MSERFRRSFSAGARRPLKLSPAAETYGEGLGGTRAAQVLVLLVVRFIFFAEEHLLEFTLRRALTSSPNLPIISLNSYKFFISDKTKN